METASALRYTTKRRARTGRDICWFIFAWWLGQFVVTDAAFKVVDSLNQRGILGLGEGFNVVGWVFWGDGIGLNLLKCLILWLGAFCFGGIFAYKARSMSGSARAVWATAITLLSVVGNIALFALILSLAPSQRGLIHDAVAALLALSVSTPHHAIFLFLQFASSLVGALMGFALGISIVSDPNHKLDTDGRRTFLGVAWYHYLWLWSPVSFYLRLVMGMIYAVFSTLGTLVRHFNLLEWLGFTTSEKGGSLDVAWGSLMFISIVCCIAVGLLEFLREILAGDIRVHWIWKVVIALGICVLVPSLIILYTNLVG